MMNRVGMILLSAVFFVGMTFFSNNIGVETGKKLQMAYVDKNIDSICTGKIQISGQDVLNAVNTYRKNKGIPEIKINKDACNNIASRFAAYTKPGNENITHPEFDTYADKLLNAGYDSVSELMTTGNTVQELINNWDGSPSHNLALNNPKYTEGCVYANVANNKTIAIVELVLR